MWWWWRACWGWCCYLSCRVRCKVSCCNTEHTAPGQRPDNWGSPVEKDRCRKMAFTFLIKMRHVEKKMWCRRGDLEHEDAGKGR